MTENPPKNNAVLHLRKNRPLDKKKIVKLTCDLEQHIHHWDSNWFHTKLHSSPSLLNRVKL